MLTKVQKWGNSIALRIPKTFADEMHLTPESAIEMRVEGGKLIIQTVGKPEFTLDGLLAGITPENLHAETEWGDAVGVEV